MKNTLKMGWKWKEPNASKLKNDDILMLLERKNRIVIDIYIWFWKRYFKWFKWHSSMLWERNLTND